MNRLRLENGLPSLGVNFQAYTDADYVLYADVPELTPTENLPDNHYFLGPILWSPPTQKPEWWNHLPADKPIIYLTLGSSGQRSLLTKLFEALARLPITVIAATAEAHSQQTPPLNIYISDYLPGIEAAKRSKLVICNGGSPTSQQALAAGVPVLGITSNLDQFLNMKTLVHAGAGLSLRADRVTAKKFCAAVTELLTVPTYTQAATGLAKTFAQYSASTRFATVIERLLK